MFVSVKELFLMGFLLFSLAFQLDVNLPPCVCSHVHCLCDARAVIASGCVFVSVRACDVHPHCALSSHVHCLQEALAL